MTRKEFIRHSAAGLLMTTSLSDFAAQARAWPAAPRMPVLFVGHGSPMNAIEDNDFSRRWSQLGQEIPRPAAVLCISAHWYTRGTRVTAMPAPPTLHDFSGFPAALSAVRYPAPGNPALAENIAGSITATQVVHDHEWGLDHGTWSITRHMYPDADIPVLQLSIDFSKPATWHASLGAELKLLRDKGVLLIGSGNMVHNLGMIDWNKPDEGFDWAIEQDEQFKSDINSRNLRALTAPHAYGTAGRLAMPTPEHYLPLLYVLGASDTKDEINIFNDRAVMGSITMTSVRMG